MKRTVIPELLDTDSGSAKEVRASLADLRFVNRWFGGASTMCDLIEHVARKTALRRVELLDVASATGDIPALALNRLRQQGIELRVTLLDRAASHFNGRFPAVLGDALVLPFADDSFDVVTCSLFAHHLEPDQLERFARESLRVARIAVLMNDLRRHPLHLALVYAGLPLFSRLTRHDAPVSIRRSYTPAELKAVLEQTDATHVEINSHYLFRMGAIAWKKPQ
jgi:ubiquinone/menaquinone biosynthesis C-methylase UbiE